MDRFYKEEKMNCAICKGSNIELKMVDEKSGQEKILSLFL